MKHTWPIIAVADVTRSTAWYRRLLDAQETHPGATVFNQIVDGDSVLLCLHHWGPSGLRGDHHWPSLSSSAGAPAGNGLLLWFVVDDLEDAWQRARALEAVVEEAPNADNGTGMPAFVVRDPDGYHVAVNEARP
jgi:catechol 2,3-dioxygenase-like lactoylglutathione lyase family enzyme